MAPVKAVAITSSSCPWDGATVACGAFPDGMGGNRLLKGASQRDVVASLFAICLRIASRRHSHSLYPGL